MINTKTMKCSNCQKQHGYALLMVLVLTATALLTVTGVMMRNTTTSKLNDRTTQRTVNMNAAEAATEKVLATMMADYQVEGEVRVRNNENSYRTLLPTRAELPYWGRFEFSDNHGNVGCVGVERISNTAYTPLDSQYDGLYGFACAYRITARVRQLQGYSDVPTVVQQDVQLAEIPVFQFAIFYNSLLEFTWAAPMTVRGRVHANDSIYTGSSDPLTFTAPVTATGTIVKKAWDGYSLGQMSGSITYQDTKATNAPALTLPIGTNNTADAVREIIQMPPSGESMYSDMGQQRYYNKAQMTIVITDAGVTAQVKQSYDASPLTIPAGQLGSFLTTDKEFTDQREGKVVSVTEIDVGNFGAWARTNSYTSTKLGSGQPPTILYVADNRTKKTITQTSTQWVWTNQRRNQGYWQTNTTTTTVPIELAAVRLTDGQKLPTSGLSGVTKGLSVVTPNPLYVLGNYNCPNSSYLNTTNTTQTEPASLVSDALTVLSPAWDDSKSSQSFKNRRASNTTINAALITGMVYSQGSDGSSPFSGGAMNITRLLEDWGNGSSTKLTLNTSIVNLFSSARATAPFQSPGYYYYAPIRDFNFDRNFMDPTKLPPGTPRVRAEIRTGWSTPAPQ